MAGGRRFKWKFLLGDVALPIIGADFLLHFGLLVDLGKMWFLACKGGWRQHLVEPAGCGMFATIGVVADEPPLKPQVLYVPRLVLGSFPKGRLLQ